MMEEIDKTKIPVHIAIIMDGNGRWAKERGISRRVGHELGVESVREVIRITAEIGVKYLTLYTFSKENWRRPKEEIKWLFLLLERVLKMELENLKKWNICIKIIGNIEEMPLRVQKILEKAQKETEKNTRVILTLALNYGGRCEIIDAIKKIFQKAKESQIDINSIDESLFRKNLYNPSLPDPDLIIRTSGEKRISNFLLWQCAYSELYFTDTHWPDFRKKEYIKAILEYTRRKRRFGGV